MSVFSWRIAACVAGALVLSGSSIMGQSQGRHAVTLATMAPVTVIASPALVQDAPAQGKREAVAPERRVTLHMRDTRLGDVLKEIARLGSVELLYSEYVVPVDKRVSIAVMDAPIAEALAMALQNTDVEMHVVADGKVVLERGAPRAASDSGLVAEYGSITGRVTDAKTGVGVEGAAITVKGITVRVETGERGEYRLDRLIPATYTLSVKRIGYGKVEREVVVIDNQMITVDFAMEPSINTLDEIVVTGTVAPTAIKALPTPITVLTARDIEQQGITRIDQLFRGLVPGAVAVDQGAADGYPGGVNFRGGTDFSQSYTDSPLKLYVDGVEIAYSNMISQIDPGTIERIEITRGPQASTVYGAGAIVGVVQIFTKRGTLGSTRPSINAQVALGALESQWRDRSTTSQDHSFGIAGGSADLTYNLSASYLETGEWVPEYRSRRTSYFGGARKISGPLAVELSAQFSDRLYNRRPYDPYYVQQVQSGRWRTANNAIVTQPFYPDITRQDRTFGSTISYQATTWWRHHLVLGYNAYDNPRAQAEARRTTPADTLRPFAEFQISRASVAYNTSVSWKPAEALSASLVLGGDRWKSHQMLVRATQLASGAFAPGRTSLTKMAYGNTGLFAQIQLGIHDALFLTSGIRADYNDNVGEEYGAAVAPRFGLAYSRPLGGAALKLRASYGKAIRAPYPTQTQPDLSGLPYWEQLANPRLAPESQSGYDAGMELYFGKHASIQATYYDQRISNLISSLTLSAPEDTIFRYYWENIGRIKNTGWELQGTATAARLTLAATYSIFNSIALKVDPDATGDADGQYHEGDRLLLIPRSSGGLSATYTFPRTRLAASMTYTGSFRNYDRIALLDDRLGGAEYRGSDRAYIVNYPASTRWSISISQDVAKQVTGFVRIDNLANTYSPQVDNISAVYGRHAVAGLKVKL